MWKIQVNLTRPNPQPDWLDPNLARPPVLPCLVEITIIISCVRFSWGSMASEKKLGFGLRPVVSAIGQKPCPKNCGTKEVACAVKCVPVVGGWDGLDKMGKS